jgi:hypothetical protein
LHLVPTDYTSGIFPLLPGVGQRNLDVLLGIENLHILEELRIHQRRHCDPWAADEGGRERIGSTMVLDGAMGKHHLALKPAAAGWGEL